MYEIINLIDKINNNYNWFIINYEAYPMDKKIRELIKNIE